MNELAVFGAGIRDACAVCGVEENPDGSCPQCSVLARMVPPAPAKIRIKRSTGADDWLCQPASCDGLGTPMSWEVAIVALVCDGLCPWCKHPIQSIEVSPGRGLTWCCFDGCNP